jgi:hypothetical protein
MSPGAATPTQIKTSDLQRIVTDAIATAEENDRRPQRAMVMGNGFEPLYRDYGRRSDRLSCFLACLAGRLEVAAPEVAKELRAFTTKVIRADPPITNLPNNDSKKGTSQHE